MIARSAAIPARLIINAAAADLQNFRLPGDRQIVLTVDHRFALSNPALVSAPSKKSFSSVSSRSWVQRLHIDRGAAVAGLPAPNTSDAHPQAELSRPSLDWVDVEVLGHWAIVRSPLTAASATFALKAGLWFRAVVCSWSLLFAAIIAAFRQKLHLSGCSNLRSRLPTSMAR